MRSHQLVLLALLTAACATTSQVLPISYKFVDEPLQRQVSVSFTNTTNRLMCLSPENWPNQAGWIDQAEGRVFIEVGASRFSMQDFNTGYCPGCATRVAPGSTLTTTIPYMRFALPDDVVAKPKALSFTPYAVPCERR